MSDYTVIELGGLSGWGSGGKRPGKRFIEGELDARNAGISVNSTDPGEEAPFWHLHTKLEEVYLVVDGRGEFAVGDEVIPLTPGTTVRVAPGAMHALRCLPDSEVPLKWLCIRSGADALADIDKDAEVDRETPFPWNV